MITQKLIRQPALRFLPTEERTPDTQYLDVLRDIYENGRDMEPVHGGFARMGFVRQLRYPIKNGFPVTGIRDFRLGFKGSIAEMIAFTRGARTLKQLRGLGVPDVFWKDTVTREKCADFGLEEGDLGPGSYGPTLTDLRTADGNSFNQIEHLLQQMKEKPNARTHILTTWNPVLALGHSGLQRKVVTAPCHGTVTHFILFPETHELVAHTVQRSGDFMTGFPGNMVQYAALAAMFAQVLNYTFAEIVYTVSDPHIYDIQFPQAQELLERNEPLRLPTVTINPEVTDFFAFTKDDFALGDDYVSYERMKVVTKA